MITLIREVCAMPGRTAAARAWAQEITAYLKDAHHLDLEVVLPLGGNPQRVAWCGRYKDFAAYESAMRKMLGDKRFSELNEKTAQLWVPGSMQDHVWVSA